MADGITRWFVRGIAGHLNFSIGIFAMFASSLTVAGNAPRISRPRDPELWVWYFFPIHLKNCRSTFFKTARYK
ncbi:MAG: hypothetical protein ACM3N7_06295 [Planctomycetaceae bacterium]